GALGRLGVADEEQVVTGIGGAYRRLTDGARLAHRAHLQIIRDDDAAEANLAAQAILHDQARERRWHAGGVQVRAGGMWGHHALDTAAARVAKRSQAGALPYGPGGT